MSGALVAIFVGQKGNSKGILTDGWTSFLKQGITHFPIALSGLFPMRYRQMAKYTPEHSLHLH
jgi:hypothetical protein